MINVVIFYDGFYETFFSFGTKEEACAFVDGVGYGSTMFGGYLHQYILPEDREEMRIAELEKQVRRALEAIA